MKLPKLIVILGPTASGKTELAIKLAKKFNGEIVSADSRQIYKEINIGTAKPTKKELKGIPYHLIDIINPKKDFNVAVYKKLAVKKIKDIQKGKKIPFLVGGTGLYISAIVDNVDFPKVIPDKRLREKLEKKTERELFKIYKKLDPEGVKFIDKNNKRRLVRAIEVCKLTGESFWQQRKKQKPIFEILEIGLKIEKKELEKKVKKRVEKMFKSGLEKETNKLCKKYGWISSLQTIGYQEFKEYFEGKIRTCLRQNLDSRFARNKTSPSGRTLNASHILTKEKTKELIELHTLQFAKRQMTWFKQSKKIIWLKNLNQIEKAIKIFLN